MPSDRLWLQPVPSIAREDRALDQIAATMGAVREFLGNAALGIYLYGSAVAGGLRPQSDLDILVISDRSLIAAERAAIIQRLLPISAGGAIGGSIRPLELSIVAQPALNPWRYPPSIELQFGEWMRPELSRGELPEWPHPDPDVAILIETAFSAAVPLVGPPIDALLSPVPPDQLHRAMADTIPILLPGIEEGDDRRNGLLALARIWMTLATGKIRPKDQAADWALAQLPEGHRAVLAHARGAYLGEEPEDWSNLAHSVEPHVKAVLDKVRHCWRHCHCDLPSAGARGSGTAFCRSRSICIGPELWPANLRDCR